KEYAKTLNQDQQKDLHQSILDLAYRYWRDNEHWSYYCLVTWIGLNYGSLAGFAVLVGKYNQQVQNGGHRQYFYNGYAGGRGAFGTRDCTECPLHMNMLALFQSLGFYDTEI